ncbi:hypothetical protein HMF8227_00256 [Saliniradius amylolyticus]|uniref:FecR N-terminal domain-containing protein n=1 Tax=Saliniradius amylolyticus TaxID=2183582 RepID=A0A2S2DZE0_9ALTE|nr:FecR/PupR family sigma factor regulator [Saliniradius amylolyticus]AWL10764.1 hypothetical protein HMF8227_00256 [Saliniradius amylolyticus]
MSIDEWVGYGIPEEIIEQAISWLTRLDSGEMSDDEKALFMSWLDDDPTHRWAFEEMSTVWARTSIRPEASVPETKPSNKSTAPSAGYYSLLSYITIALIALGLVAGIL